MSKNAKIILAVVLVVAGVGGALLANNADLFQGRFASEVIEPDGKGYAESSYIAMSKGSKCPNKKRVIFQNSFTASERGDLTMNESRVAKLRNVLIKAIEQGCTIKVVKDVQYFTEPDRQPLSLKRDLKSFTCKEAKFDHPQEFVCIGSRVARPVSRADIIENNRYSGGMYHSDAVTLSFYTGGIQYMKYYDPLDGSADDVKYDLRDTVKILIGK